MMMVVKQPLRAEWVSRRSQKSATQLMKRCLTISLQWASDMCIINSLFTAFENIPTTSANIEKLLKPCLIVALLDFLSSLWLF